MIAYGFGLLDGVHVKHPLNKAANHDSWRMYRILHNMLNVLTVYL